MYLINQVLLVIGFLIMFNCKSNNDNKENRTRIKTNQDLNDNKNIIKEVGKNKIEIKNSIEEIDNEEGSENETKNENNSKKNISDQNKNDSNLQNIPNHNQFNQNIPNPYLNPYFLSQMNNQFAQTQLPNNQFYNNQLKQQFPNNQCPYFNNNLMPPYGYTYNNFPLQNHINNDQYKNMIQQNANNQYSQNDSGLDNENKNIVDQSKKKKKLKDQNKPIN